VTKLGGKVKNCIGGPGKDYRVSGGGIPIGVDYYTDGIGINEVLSIASPMEKGRGGVAYRANFFSLTATSSFPANTSDIPTGIKGPTNLISGNPYYVFGCMDKADDYIARIRVLIRSWDSVTGFDAKNGPYGSGNEPTFGDAWHDTAIWEDLGTNYPNGI
jgi:hypothetical protein